MSTRAPRRAYEDSWNTAIVDPNGEDIVLNDKVQFLDNMGRYQRLPATRTPSSCWWTPRTP